jgi:hypothetical protein
MSTKDSFDLDSWAQMIWRSTQKLGCATARNNKCNMKDYYVCRYSPVSFVVCTICHRFHCVCKFINKMAGLDAVFKLYRGSRTQRGCLTKSIHNCFAGRQCQPQIFFPWQRQSAIMPIYDKIELIILVAVFKLIHSQLTYSLKHIAFLAFRYNRYTVSHKQQWFECFCKRCRWFDTSCLLSFIYYEYSDTCGKSPLLLLIDAPVSDLNVLYFIFSCFSHHFIYAWIGPYLPMC